MGRPAGARVRLRGPDGRPVGAAPGARRAAPTSTSRCRTSPGRPAFASLARTAADLAGLADGRVEELPPAYAEIAHPALAHLERTLFADGAARRAAAARRRGALPRGQPAPRGSLELVADEVLDLLRDGTAARGGRPRLPVRSTASARRSRPCCRRRASPTRSRAASASGRRRSATPCSRRSASSGSPGAAATSSASSARRTPALPARTPTISRAASAASGSAPRSRSASSPCAASRCPALGRRPGGRDADRGRARPRRARCCAEPTGSRRRRSARPRGSTCGPSRRSAALLRELEGWRELAGELGARGRARGARAAARQARLGRGARAGRRARPRSAPGRAASTTVFVLGLEEGSFPRRASAVALPRRRRPPGARRADALAPRPARAGRRASATSSTPPARGRRGGSTSCARRRPTTAPRGSRAPSGTRRARCSTRPRWRRWTRRRPLSALTWPLEERRRPSASGCARSPSLAVARPPARPRRSPPRTAGSGGCSGRARRSSAATELTSPAVLAELAGARRPSTSPSSRPSPRARRSGSWSACSRRGRSTPRWTRSSAGRSPTRRSHRFYAGLPEGGRHRAGRAGASRGRRPLPAAAASRRRSRASARS